MINRINFLFSLFGTVLLFLFVILIFFRPVSSITQDLGRHLKLGEIIWISKQIPATNLFSYTLPDQPFINHHWGSEVFYFLLYQAGEFNILEIFNLILAVCAFGIIFYVGVKKGSLWAAFLAGGVYFPLVLERTDVRPEVFGYLFISLILFILFTHRLKWIYVFIISIIQLIWINIHITFIFGYIIIGLYLFSEVLKSRSIKLSPPYLLILPVMVIAGLINPMGLKGLLAPLTIFHNYGYSIVENQSVFFLYRYSFNPLLPYFFIASGVSFVSSLILFFKKEYFASLLGIVFTILAFTASRHFPFFILTSFAASCISLKLLKRISNIKFHFALTILSIFWISWWLIGIGNGSIYRQWGSEKQAGLGVVKGAKGAIDFMERNNIGGPIFNNFDIGSYIIFRLYPKEKVFVDGRPEAYSTDFFQRIYIPMQQDKTVWEEQLKKYNFQSIVFSHSDQTPWGRSFVQNITNDPKWKTIYLDEMMIILVRTNDYPNLIDISPPTLKASSQLLSLEKSWIAYRQMARFFSMINREDLASWYYQQSSYLPWNFFL